MTVSVGRLRSATPVRWSSDLVPREVLSWRRRPKTWQNPASTQESWGRDSDQRCLGPAAQVASRVHERTVEVEALHRLAAAASRRSTPRSGCSSGQSESARKPMCQRAPLAAWTGCIRRLKEHTQRLRLRHPGELDYARRRSTDVKTTSRSRPATEHNERRGRRWRFSRRRRSLKTEC
jgi:hypothetical protein